MARRWAAFAALAVIVVFGFVYWVAWLANEAFG